MTALQGVPTYGDGVGVYTVTDDKLAMAGLPFQTAPGVVLPGVFYAGVDTLVTGTAGMAYSVAAYRCVTTRGASGGAILGGNDGPLSVSTTAAPGSNSRIDLIVHWQREFQIDGTNSAPQIFVVQGTAGAVPVAPSLSAYPGAIELARATVNTGATATNGGGVTITQTFPMTCAVGGVPRFRSTTDRDARFASPWVDVVVDVAGQRQVRGSTAWHPDGAYRMAMGSVASGSSTGNNSVSFPSGRFTVTPLVQVTPLNPAAGAVDFFFAVTSVTTSGCTVQISNSGGFVSGVGFVWQAVQMTPTTAAG